MREVKGPHRVERKVAKNEGIFVDEFIFIFFSQASYCKTSRLGVLDPDLIATLECTLCIWHSDHLLLLFFFQGCIQVWSRTIGGHGWNQPS